MFNKFAIKATQLTGSPIGFSVALLLVIGWAIGAKDLSYNDFITMITFLMVFVIQYSQNKDTTAIHLKLDELIKSHKEARNEVAGVEEKSVKEIKEMKEGEAVNDDVYVKGRPNAGPLQVDVQVESCKTSKGW